MNLSNPCWMMNLEEKAQFHMIYPSRCGTFLVVWDIHHAKQNCNYCIIYMYMYIYIYNLLQQFVWEFVPSTMMVVGYAEALVSTILLWVDSCRPHPGKNSQYTQHQLVSELQLVCYGFPWPTETEGLWIWGLWVFLSLISIESFMNATQPMKNYVSTKPMTRGEDLKSCL